MEKRKQTGGTLERQKGNLEKEIENKIPGGLEMVQFFKKTLIVFLSLSGIFLFSGKNLEREKGEVPARELTAHLIGHAHIERLSHPVKKAVAFLSILNHRNLLLINEIPFNPRLLMLMLISIILYYSSKDYPNKSRMNIKR